MYKENGRSDAERQAANERLRAKYPHMTPYFDAVQEFAVQIADEVRVPLRVEDRRKLFVAAAFRDYPDQADTIAKMAGFPAQDIPRVVREAHRPDLQRVIRIAEKKKEEAKQPFKQAIAITTQVYAGQLEEVRDAYVALHPKRSNKGPTPGTDTRIKRLNSFLRQRQAGVRTKDIEIPGFSKSSVPDLRTELVAMKLIDPLEKEKGVRAETERKLEEIWDIQTDHPEWTTKQITEELAERGIKYTERTVQEMIGILLDEGLLEYKHRPIGESAQIVERMIIDMVLENPGKPIDRTKIAVELKVTTARVTQVMAWMRDKRNQAQDNSTDRS